MFWSVAPRLSLKARRNVYFTGEITGLDFPPLESPTRRLIVKVSLVRSGFAAAVRAHDAGRHHDDEWHRTSIGTGGPRAHSTSRMPAAPMPVPMHIVIMPYPLKPFERIPWTSVAVRMAPVAPRG